MIMMGLSGVDIYRWAKKHRDNKKIVLSIIFISVICSGLAYFYFNQVEPTNPDTGVRATLTAPVRPTPEQAELARQVGIELEREITKEEKRQKEKILRQLHENERGRVQHNRIVFLIITIFLLSIFAIILIKWGAIKGRTKRIDLYSNSRKAFVALWKNALAIIMLIAAMNDIDEEGYYTLLRIVIFLLSLEGAFRWFKLARPVLYFSFIGLAILFNPIVQIHFDRDIWFVIDSIAIALFTIEGYFRLKAKGLSQ